jgi:hypothetical protein
MSDQLNLFRNQPPEPHVYACGTCGGRWSQVDGTDPQTHRPGCPHAAPTDVVLPRVYQLTELPGETFEDIFGGAA